MKNVIMTVVFAVATMGVSYGECVNGSCSVTPVRNLGSRMVQVTKEVVTVPFHVARRVTTLPSRVRHNRLSNTSR
ncbi:MAG: hypothetical protein WD512_17480 [Candidatus Paceibacterota bacterium]